VQAELIHAHIVEAICCYNTTISISIHSEMMVNFRTTELAGLLLAE
jgi:hypothetical protein